MESNVKIAALLTCHNRREKTRLCLEALFRAVLRLDHKLDVYLVDDGSTDGTGETVAQFFPEVNVIQGDGSLFWNQGMRLAWNTASGKDDYDFYLWLNDDTILNAFALTELFDCFQKVLEADKQAALIVGACESSEGSREFSYGGRNDAGPVIPNGELQTCKYINGNVVLVPKAIFEKLGNLSNDYTHAMGDIDYGLRAGASYFSCYSTTQYVAACPRHNSVPDWKNPEVPLARRWRSIHSPRGLNLKEYNRFRRKFWGHLWIKYALQAYMKVLIPRIYSKISRL